VIKKELDIFFAAIMFFTRIPVPKIKNYSPNYLQQSAKYFSWVGLLVAFIAGLVYYIVNLFLHQNIAIMLSMLASILTTGAFHEDGFADSCDAFGGGYTKEKILTIMKDSRLGTYGVIGLIGILSFKYIFLSNLAYQLPAKYIVFLLMAAHSASRMMAVFIMQFYSYVQDIDASKSKPLANQKLSTLQLIIAILGAAISFLFLFPFFIFAIIPVFATTLACGKFFNKHIQGYTGDCLGATQQITEVVFYFAIICLLKVYH
jgi:adenosylcobinamide-GDP ribazoletransferase